MSVIKLVDLDLKGKRVFIRADLNVPVKDGKVTSDARITASMATINHCLKQGAKVMVTSHLGRPEEGVWTEENSLKPVADNIADRLGKPVRLIKDWVDGGFDVAAGELVVLENCRFNKGEKKNVEETSQKYAKLCDVFVMDAWGKNQNVGDKIMMLADGDGEFTKALGLELDLRGKGLGVRSQRYAMIVEDGIVKSLQIDPPKTFEISKAEAVLERL